ncbi:8179_t:CDS:2 [Funneliformis caledonium]|uniref:8179_t:CDS:1 n=1 Tax=Funneliformis caledonium TaxID=1117310 RepID=A0A9N9B170_9GLOM|nr:8179_t:CDS:2 [Funneliformis caledonium]
MNDNTLSIPNNQPESNMDTRHDLETSRKDGAEEWRATIYNTFHLPHSDSYGMGRSVLPIYDKVSANKRGKTSENLESSEDISISTFESNHKLDNSYNQGATTERSETFSSTSSPPLSKSGADATDRDLETRKLLGNQSMDASSSNKTEPSSQYSHAVSKEEDKNVSLPKLPNVPHHLVEKLKDKLYNIANKDLWFFDEEHREHFAEEFGVTNICPLYVDHYGFAMWMLDENKRLLLWNEMENSITYLGLNLTEGFTNYLIHPDRLCYITDDNFRLVPVDEFERQIMVQWGGQNYVVVDNISLFIYKTRSYFY